MRAREILDENYNQSLESDLTNLIIGAKGSGASEVSTRALVLQLQNMGYAVDENSLQMLLSDNPAVMSSTEDTVTFNEPGASAPEEDPAEDSAEKVKAMAADASTLNEAEPYWGNIPDQPHAMGIETKNPRVWIRRTKGGTEAVYLDNKPVGAKERDKKHPDGEVCYWYGHSRNKDLMGHKFVEYDAAEIPRDVYNGLVQDLINGE